MTSAIYVDTISDKDGNFSVDVADLSQVVVAGTAQTSKTANYTLTSSDSFIEVSGASGAFTITLPPAATNATKEYTIYRTDNTLANAITISGTIDGDTDWKLHTIGECYHIKSDGTEYKLLSHKTTTKQSASTVIGLTSTGTALVKGTTSLDSITWAREGRYAFIQVRYFQTGAGTSGTGEYLIALPTGLVADTTLVDVNTSATVYNLFGKGMLDGTVGMNGNSGSMAFGAPVLYDSTHVRFAYLQDGAAAITRWNAASFGLATYATMPVIAWFRVPISGWKE